MGDAKVRFAEGEIGKLFSFTGKDVPSGATPLTEEDGTSLTEAGKAYCQKRKLNPHVESIRVQYGQQTSYAVLHAAEASIKNQEIRLDEDAKKKAVSERLRLDWAQQDKAYQDALKARS
jgi:hypothetical protein